MSSTVDALKKKAAEQAVERVQSGMAIGLGTGSTVDFALLSIAEKLRTGELGNVRGVPSSIQTERRARELGIPLTNFEQDPVLDLTIDGADEIDPELRLIKGGGAALLREKIVAQASLRLLIVADESKLSTQIGTIAALPLEIVPFGYGAVVPAIESLGASVEMRLDRDGHPVRTDQENWILDCDFGPIQDPVSLGLALKGCAGIVEHGLFIGLASEAIIAGAEGVRSLKPARGQKRRP